MLAEDIIKNANMNLLHGFITWIYYMDLLHEFITWIY